MKKSLILLLAASMFTAAVPAMAMDHTGMAMDHTGMAMQPQHDEQCQKECDMLVKNCRTQVDSIQQRIQKLSDAVHNHADNYTLEQLSQLKRKLEDAQSTLASLEEAGGK